MSDWLEELDNIRRSDAEQPKEPVLNLSILNRHEKSVNALKICDAHNLLRKVNNVLLHGKGLIDVFDRTNEYDRAITLVWQGPISQARKPNTDDSSGFQHIVVGANGSKVYVNGHPLEHNTPDSLKKALVWAARNPKSKK